ncbi:MAG: hypothetical protein ACEPOV_11520 [Hyphomicrobiales bacterium]
MKKIILILIAITLKSCCSLPLVDCIRYYKKYFLVTGGLNNNINYYGYDTISNVYFETDFNKKWDIFKYKDDSLEISINPIYKKTLVNRKDSIYTFFLKIKIKNKYHDQLYLKNKNLNIKAKIKQDTLLCHFRNLNERINIGQTKVDTIICKFKHNIKYNNFQRDHKLLISYKPDKSKELIALFVTKTIVFFNKPKK